MSDIKLPTTKEHAKFFNVRKEQKEENLRRVAYTELTEKREATEEEHARIITALENVLKGDKFTIVLVSFGLACLLLCLLIEPYLELKVGGTLGFWGVLCIVSVFGLLIFHIWYWKRAAKKENRIYKAAINREYKVLDCIAYQIESRSDYDANNGVSTVWYIASVQDMHGNKLPGVYAVSESSYKEFLQGKTIRCILVYICDTKQLYEID